jgi:hypothetical protein
MVGCNHHCEREEGNAHSPPDIHYSKEPIKGKRLRIIVLAPVQGHNTAIGDVHNVVLPPAKVRRFDSTLKPLADEYGKVEKIYAAVMVQVRQKGFGTIW